MTRYPTESSRALRRVPIAEALRAKGYIRTNNLEVVVLAAALFCAGLAYLLLSYLRSRGHLADSVIVDAGIAIAVFFAAIVAARDLELAALSLPVSLTLMVAPELPHLPFVREFGAISLLGITVRLLYLEYFRGSTHIRRALPAILSHPQLVAGLALIALSLVPLLVSSASGNFHTAKVIAAHMIACGLAWLLVSLVIMAVHWHGEVAAERLLDGLFIASVVTVAFAVLSLAFPFLVNEEIAWKSYYGTYFYCRLKTTFHGPADFSTYVCVAIPILMLFTTRDRDGWRRKLAVASLIAVPLILVAGSSRTARVAAILSFGVLAWRREYRTLALSVGAFAVALIFFTVNYRCTMDMASAATSNPTNNGGIIPMSQYFVDHARSDLRANALKFFSLPSSLGWENAWRYAVHVLFGNGAGVSGYAVFGKGTHFAFGNLIIDTGLIGAALILYTMARSAAQLTAAWTFRNLKERQRLFVLSVTLIPIGLASATEDTQLWLFTWFVVALILADPVQSLRVPHTSNSYLNATQADASQRNQAHL